jgi:hypothetical protein
LCVVLFQEFSLQESRISTILVKILHLLCVVLFQEYSLQESRISTILVKILHVLYDMDVLHEQVLFKWHRTIPQTEDVPEREKLRKQVNIVLND